MLATSDPAAACQIRLKPGGSLQTIGFCDSKAKTNRSIRYPGKELIFLRLSSEVDDRRYSNTISTTESPYNTRISLSASAAFRYGGIMRTTRPSSSVRINVCHESHSSCEILPGSVILGRPVLRAKYPSSACRLKACYSLLDVLWKRGLVTCRVWDNPS